MAFLTQHLQLALGCCRIIVQIPNLCLGFHINNRVVAPVPCLLIDGYFCFLVVPRWARVLWPEVKGVRGLLINEVQKPWAAALPNQPPRGPASSESTWAWVEQHLLVWAQLSSFGDEFGSLAQLVVREVCPFLSSGVPGFFYFRQY